MSFDVHVPKTILQEYAAMEDLKEVFLDGICLVTCMIDLSNFIMVLKKKLDLDITTNFDTTFSLYHHDIRALFLYLMDHSGDELESLAAEVLQQIKSFEQFSTDDKWFTEAHRWMAINLNLQEPVKDINVIKILSGLLWEKEK